MQVNVWRYDYDHEKLIRDWLVARGLDGSMACELPEIGFMAYVDNEPVAAGFVRKLSEETAMIDSYVTDPVAAPEARTEALDALTKVIVDFSREIGVKKLIALTEDKNTELRALKHGFSEAPHKALVMRFD